MDFIQQLRIFASVVENGSFARAADALSVGRPSVTNAVSGLEDTIGARLLHRTTRRLSLTGEGEVFYERTLKILADVEAAQNLFGGSSQAPRGRLRVDIPVALAKPLIIPQLPDFARRYPDIEIILGVSDHPIDLLAEGVDCVLRVGDLAASSMISRVIADVEMVTCAAPSYLAANGTPQSVDDLAQHRAVTYFAGRGRDTIDWRLIESGKERAVRLRPAILVNDTEAFIACALAGLGLVQAIRAGVHGHLDDGALVEVLPDLRVPARPVSVMFPARQHVAPQVRAFIDWLPTVFKGHSPSGSLVS